MVDGSGTTSNTYDNLNRLTAGALSSVELTRAGTLSAWGNNAYDGHGTRTSRTIGALTQHFAWDTHASLPLVLTDGTTSYLYDDAGTPIEQVDPAGVALYNGHDQYGSTRLLTDATGAVAATFTYDPYGNLTAHTGATDTPLRWNGQYQDTDTGLYYLRARYYDPVTAQFLTGDPLVALTLAAYGLGGSAQDAVGFTTGPRAEERYANYPLPVHCAPRSHPHRRPTLDRPRPRTIPQHPRHHRTRRVGGTR